MFERTFNWLNLLLLRVGLTLLDRKIYTRLYLGSTQTQVPVNPVCPNVAGETLAEG